MDVCIRADGGSQIGYGHLVRTGALAEEFLSAGHRVHSLTLTPDPAREVYPDAVDVVALESTSEMDDLWRAIERIRPSVVVTDSYEIGTDYQRQLAESVPTLAIVLDDTRHEVCADVLINGNVYARELEYDWTGTEPRWCLGLDYLLIRQSFRKRACEQPPWNETPQSALVIMGGSDINNATPAAIRAFDGGDVTVNVVVGPGFDNQREIEKAVSETNATVELLYDPDDLVDRMMEADLAVSAAGSTIYELLATGTPTIGIPQADNQEPIADALSRRDAIVALDSVERAPLSASIDELLQSSQRRQSLREKGRALVDCRGTKRVYDAITEANGHE